jgi:hypothetical protein
MILACAEAPFDPKIAEILESFVKQRNEKKS